VYRNIALSIIAELNWENLNTPGLRRLFRLVIAWLCTAGLLTLGYFLLYGLRDSKGIWTAVVVTTFNALLPVFMKVFTTQIEIHVDESNVQDSIM